MSTGSRRPPGKSTTTSARHEHACLRRPRHIVVSGCLRAREARRHVRAGAARDPPALVAAASTARRRARSSSPTAATSTTSRSPTPRRRFGGGAPTSPSPVSCSTSSRTRRPTRAPSTVAGRRPGTARTCSPTPRAPSSTCRASKPSGRTLRRWPSATAPSSVSRATELQAERAIAADDPDGDGLVGEGATGSLRAWSVAEQIAAVATALRELHPDADDAQTIRAGVRAIVADLPLEEVEGLDPSFTSGASFSSKTGSTTSCATRHAQPTRPSGSELPVWRRPPRGRINSAACGG